MVTDPISAELRSFLVRHIDSIAQLEALLLMRADPSVGWSVPAMAGRLYSTEEQALEALSRLQGEGLVCNREGSFTYAPGSDHAAIVDELANAYRDHLIAVTNIVHNKPPRVHQFADAFNLRRRT